MFKLVKVFKMPPKQRTGSVSKQCEECGGANPVACKICKINKNEISKIVFGEKNILNTKFIILM